MMFVQRYVARAIIAAAFCVWFAGCSSAGKSTSVRVTPSSAPTVARVGLADMIPEEDPRRGLIAARPETFREENLQLFAGAREAYWNYNLAEATELLRRLRANDGMSDDHFFFLTLQCYEQSNLWAETLPLYASLGIDESHREWLDFARLRAELPVTSLRFSPHPKPVPFTLKNGDLVIVNVTINGVDARVLVDTGANLSWWSKSFARRVGLKFLDQTVQLNDAHDRARKTDLVLIDELKIGGLTARHLPALAGRSWWFRILLGIDGIIGWDLLQRAHLTFDFPERRLTIAEPVGPVADEPKLAGRVAPILTVLTEQGQPLQLFLDTGASGWGRLDLYENEGLIRAKTPVAAFRRGWRPTISMGMHSVEISWPWKVKPFSFWFEGYQFELPGADISRGLHRQEQFTYLDGLVGNAPFLSGRLTLCGVRRIATFEPSVAVTRPAAAAAASAR